MHCADEPTGRPRYSWGTGRSRNVRAPQSRAVANGHPGRPAGQCHREQTACRATRPVRVKRWGKSPPAPQATAAARQTPPGARPRSRRPRAARPSLRVGRVSPPATAGQDGWSPPPPATVGGNRTRRTGRLVRLLRRVPESLCCGAWPIDIWECPPGRPGGHSHIMLGRPLSSDQSRSLGHCVLTLM